MKLPQVVKMNEVKIRIDGREASAREGMTILEAAKLVGIEIPTLCYHQDLAPSGNCRVCVVEVEGARTLVGACHTPVGNGMVIHTRSPKVLAARKATVELLMAGHTGECVADEHTHKCDLRKLADLLEGGAPRFLMRKPRWYPVEELNPYVLRDMSKCILCRKCIGACWEIAKKNVYGIAYRGFASKVVVDFDDPLTTEICRDCGICIDYCPTGALSKPIKPGEVK
jgi:NADH dehydrogenase/NADH:ubiquinone oxidoreductase subunit G